MWDNSKNQNVTKLNNSICEKIIKKKMWQNSKTQNLSKLKILQNLKTKNTTKMKKKLKMRQN